MADEKIAIYHRIMKRETFEVAAKDLLSLIQKAEKNSPGKERILYVDIDGHRNEEGGFDEDMFELQKEYGMGFLLQFVKEIHFPLISVNNPNEQNNDIPEELHICYVDNSKDASLDELYIENYSNTEFIMEPDVYDYLKHFSALLRHYNEWDIGQKKSEEEIFDESSFMQMWYKHIGEIMNELFNNFIHGNLLSAAAMTRTLIECYVYLSILLKEQDIRLVEDWFFCSVMAKIKNKGELTDNVIETIKKYCINRNIDFNEIYNKFYGKSENSWLSRIIDKKKIVFRDACEYLNRPEIDGDYKFLCAFVHGQDVNSKLMPFTFYSSIYEILYLMSEYIFASIRMIKIKNKLEDEIMNLEEKLFELGKQYI